MNYLSILREMIIQKLPEFSGVYMRSHTQDYHTNSFRKLIEYYLLELPDSITFNYSSKKSTAHNKLHLYMHHTDSLYDTMYHDGVLLKPSTIEESNNLRLRENVGYAVIDKNQFYLNLSFVLVEGYSPVIPDNELVFTKLRIFQDLPEDIKKQIMNPGLESIFLLPQYKDDLEKKIKLERIKKGLETINKKKIRVVESAIKNAEHDINVYIREIEKHTQKREEALVEKFYLETSDPEDLFPVLQNILLKNKLIEDFRFTGTALKFTTKRTYMNIYDEEKLKKFIERGTLNEVFNKVLDGTHKVGLGRFEVSIDIHKCVRIGKPAPLSPYHKNKHIEIGCEGTFASEFRKAAKNKDLTGVMLLTIQWLQTINIADSVGLDSIKNWGYIVDTETGLLCYNRGNVHTPEDNFKEEDLQL